MPPKIKIKKTDILKATYEIMRIDGMDAVNARRIAKELHCSVQPVFSNFHNMEELKKEAVSMVYKRFIEEVLSYDDHKQPYKSMGCNYIRFAQNEPKLFETLFMSQTGKTFQGFVQDIFPDFKQIEMGILNIADVDQKKIPALHYKMWFFTHGIASLAANKIIRFTDEEIDKLLSDEFKALVLLEQQKQHSPQQISKKGDLKE